MKTQAKSEYDIQAETFLEKAGIAFSARFLFHGPHFEDDKENRNVWLLTLSKGTGKGQQLEVKFGQSISDSFAWPSKDHYSMVSYNNPKRDKNPHYSENHKKPSQNKKPTAYDILACLTKNDPGSFEDFCSEYGCDTDSRKAEKTYFAVQEEWSDVSRFFTQEEIEALQEIN